MNSVVVRMGVVIAAVVAVQLGFLAVGKLGTPPEVVQPARPLKDFPLQVTTQEGKWQGQEEQLDPRTFVNTEASLAVSRRYKSLQGQSSQIVFLAQYDSPAAGLYHSPSNCYRSNGYTLVYTGRRPLKAPNRPDTVVDLSMWEKDGERKIVVFWYELGEFTMFERGDLFPVQLKMYGKTKWPPLFKALLEIPASQPEMATAQILDMAQVVREWLGQAQPVLD